MRRTVRTGWVAAVARGSAARDGPRTTAGSPPCATTSLPGQQHHLRAPAHDPFAHARRREEVALELDRGERRAVGDVAAAPDRRARVGEGDDGRGEEEAGAGDQVLRDVEVPEDERRRNRVEHAAEL